MLETKVISAFPGTGKTYLHQNNTSITILDSDSSMFSWSGAGVRDPNFPSNYIDYIKQRIGKIDIILVSSHKVVRDELKKYGILYTLVYPDKSLKDEYLKRYRDRGNDEGFINMIDKNWDNFIDELDNETYPQKLKMKANEYLKDMF
jgi:hypothetical protein